MQDIPKEVTWPFGARILFIPTSSHTAQLGSKDEMGMGDAFSPTEIGSLFHSFFFPPTGDWELESKILLDGREWCVCARVSTND